MKALGIILLLVASFTINECTAGQLTTAGCLTLTEDILSFFPATCPPGYGYIFTYLDGTPIYGHEEIVASDWDELLRTYNLLGCCPPGDAIACLVNENSYFVDTCVNGKSCCTDDSGDYIGCDWVCR